MSRKSRKRMNTTSKFIALLVIAVFLGMSITYAAGGKEKVSPVISWGKGLFAASPASEPPLTPGQDNIIPPGELDSQAEQVVNAMSDEQMAGQMLMLGFSGTEPDYYIQRMINLRHAGGIVLFDRNIQNSAQVTAMNKQLQKLAIDNNKLPLFIAVDQEGGEVSRFEGILTTTGASVLGQTASSKEVAAAARDNAGELKAMGVNVNFAPVVDVSAANSIMNLRSYGDDPGLVAEMGIAAAAGYRAGKVIPCVKHFPGLGRASHDPHTGPVEIKINLADLSQVDLTPFRRAIAENIEMVMVSHALYPDIDAGKPASVSPAIQGDILRDMLGYQGIIVSDDLEMGAVTNKDTVGNWAVQAIKAGTDIVLICHTPEKQAEAYDAIVLAIKNGEIDKEKIKDSVKRIVKLKLEYLV